jgi:transcriptional regulator with XRE-family HTH domain
MEVAKLMYHYQRLRDLREDADLKQRHIAELLDMTAQQYSLYERGDREIPFHHVITLAKYYGVSIDYIAGLTNRKNRE